MCNKWPQLDWSTAGTMWFRWYMSLLQCHHDALKLLVTFEDISQSIHLVPVNERCFKLGRNIFKSSLQSQLPFFTVCSSCDRTTRLHSSFSPQSVRPLDLFSHHKEGRQLAFHSTTLRCKSTIKLTFKTRTRRPPKSLPTGSILF